MATISKCGPVSTITPEPAPALDKLDCIASDIERATRRVQGFVNRFHGHDSCEPCEETESSSYSAALERLQSAAAELDICARGLRVIG
jgi:hypothetical protein